MSSPISAKKSVIDSQHQQLQDIYDELKDLENELDALSTVPNSDIEDITGWSPFIPAAFSLYTLFFSFAFRAGSRVREAKAAAHRPTGTDHRINRQLEHAHQFTRVLGPRQNNLQQLAFLKTVVFWRDQKQDFFSVSLVILCYINYPAYV